MADDATSTAASGAGAVLAGAARVVAGLRTAAKPLHPRGSTWSATVVRPGGATTGVSWFDHRGRDDAVVRLSRAVGLPDAVPDIHGLALRVQRDEGGVADVLLATTGAGPIGRFMLRAGRSADAMFFGSLLPYRAASGAVLVGALMRDEGSWDLMWASGRGPWMPFARLLVEDSVPGLDISFDPVLNLPPGLAQYDALARLRLPAYRTARRSRGDSIAPSPAGTPQA